MEKQITLKIGSKFIMANGKRVGVNYFPGPWIAGVDPTTIKIRPRKSYSFPREIADHFAITNNSDIMTDYFEHDCVTVTASHPLYGQIRRFAQ